MIKQLVELLQQTDFDLDAEQIADILWLAQKIQPESASVSPELESVGEAKTVIIEKSEVISLESHPPGDISTEMPLPKTAKAYTSDSPSKQTSQKLPFWAPAARSLRNPLELGRALRPLRKKVPSPAVQVMDEEATVEQIAETKMWVPVMRAAPERWLDLALVVEQTSLTEVWRKTINEFQQLLEHLGAFRTVRVWTMRRSTQGKLELLARHSKGKATGRKHHPKELIDPSRRRLILVLSDCTSVSWWQGLVHEWLKLWATTNWVTVVQLLPERLWERGVLGEGLPVWLRATEPGAKSVQWKIDGLPAWREVETKGALTFPVVTLEALFLGRWAQILAGMGGVQTAGVLFEPGWLDEVEGAQEKIEPSPAPEHLVWRFQATASPLARRLAVLMAAAPVNLRVVELIQETLLRESQQVHVAEVLMSGMLKPTLDGDKPVRFEFVPGVREQLRQSGSKSQLLNVLNAVSKYVAERTNLSLQSFAALLEAVDSTTDEVRQEVLPFAEVTVDVLQQMGGEYAAFAEHLQKRITPTQTGVGSSQSGVGEKTSKTSDLSSDISHPDFSVPPLQTFEFETARVVFEEDEPSQEVSGLERFEFKVATIEVQQKQDESLTEPQELVIRKQPGQARQFVEQLGNGVSLEMVVIPEGTFLMGSPQDEPQRYDQESPQHEVSVPAFFMGKYPVTQAQWRMVAGLPQVKQELDPDPSEFNGENHPVENVSWHDATEFCARLSQLTGKPYRLPTEAQWEYACRAGTMTPFHFGETITPELANYDWDETYGFVKVTKEKDFQGTTAVGRFDVANAFGLYDMHGNVWEWCEDHWHGNYERAPTDGSAWIDSEAEEDAERVQRGGSWKDVLYVCRSASRSYDNARFGSINRDGFRVVCGVPRTLGYQN